MLSIIMNILALVFMLRLIDNTFVFFNFMFIDPFNTYMVILILFFSTIFLHEFGHLLMGKLVGYRLLEIRIWFISFSRIQSDRKKSFKISLKNVLSLNGYTFMSANTTENFLLKETIFLSGGIVFNLITLLLILSYELSNPILSTQNYFFLTMFALLQFLFLMINAFPIFSREAVFDGSKIFNLFFNKPFKNCLIADNLNIRGIRPRDWINYDLFLNLTNNLTDYDFSLKLYELQSYMDKKEKEQAGILAQELLQYIQYPSIEIHDSICIHCALYYSFMDFQVDKIQECVNLIRNKFNPTALSRAFLSVIQAKVTGTSEQVRKNSLSVLDILKDLPMKGLIDFYTDLIN